MTRPILYDYYRSSAAYRVRIALNMKGVDYESVPIDLAAGGQKTAAYQARNPQGLVPMLEIGDLRLSQSLAIIDLLDTRWPEPRLIPQAADARAHALEMALMIVSDVHPLNNLRVLKYLVGPLGQDAAAKRGWIAHWIAEGFAALETHAEALTTPFLGGGAPGIADLCLVPQMYNARRFDVPLDAYPRLVAIDAAACRLEPFAAAHPDRAATPED